MEYKLKKKKGERGGGKRSKQIRFMDNTREIEEQKCYLILKY